MPTIALNDSFNGSSIDAAKWIAPGTLLDPSPHADIGVSQDAGRASINVPATSSTAFRPGGFVSQSAYDLTGNRVFVELVQATSGSNTACGLYLRSADRSAGFNLEVQGGNVTVKHRSGGSDASAIAQIPYNTTNHRWLCVRHDTSGDQVIYEVAPATAAVPPLDSDWVEIGRQNRPIDVTSLKVSLEACSFGSVPTTTGAVFDNCCTVATGPAPTLTIGSGPTVMDDPAGQKVTAGGSVNFGGDATGTMSATVISEPAGTVLGPWPVTLDGGRTAWTFERAIADIPAGTWRVKPMVSANGQSAVATSGTTFEVDEIGGDSTLPDPPSSGVAPTFTTAATLPAGTAGQAMSVQLVTTGDTPQTFTVLSGAPSGLVVASGTGVMSWPAPVAGTYSAIVVQSTNAAGSATRTFSLTVAAASATARYADSEPITVGGVVQASATGWRFTLLSADLSTVYGAATVNLNAQGVGRLPGLALNVPATGAVLIAQSPDGTRRAHMVVPTVAA